MSIEKEKIKSPQENFGTIKKMIDEMLKDTRLTKKERKEILNSVVEWREMQNQVIDEAIEEIKKFSRKYWYSWFASEIEKREEIFFNNFENNYTTALEEIMFLTKKISEIKNTIIQYSFSSYENKIPELEKELYKAEQKKSYILAKYWITEQTNITT